MKLLGLCVVLVLTVGSQAYAEKVRTNQAAKLLNHPGERGKVVLNLKVGQSMTVLAKEGRWVKVRVQGRTGFVPRSKLDMADDGELARNTRRRPFVDGRSTQRGFGSQEAPEDRIGADATDPASSITEDDSEGGKAKPPRRESKDDSEDNEQIAPPKVKAKPPRRESKDDSEDNEEVAPPKVKANAPRSTLDVDGDVAAKPKPGNDDGDAAAHRETAHVRVTTKIFSERDKRSDVSFTAAPSDALYPTDVNGTWTLVESDDGDIGWVPTSSLDHHEEVASTGGRRRRSIDLKAGLGVSFIQQSMRTVGTTKTGADQVPDIYNIGTAAAVIDVGGRFLFPLGGSLLVGGELQFDAAKTVLGGVSYKSTTTGLTLADLNLRGVVAYPTQVLRGMVILGKLGFRYRSYLVDDYKDAMKNAAKIPQEILKAPTVGVGVSLPNLTDSIGLQVGIDTILFGSSVTQTAGLEDGATPGMSSVRVNIGGVYHWKHSIDLQAAYDLDYASYSFGTPNTGAAMQSTRGHTGTDVSRTDIIHTVSIGVAKAF